MSTIPGKENIESEVTNGEPMEGVPAVVSSFGERESNGTVFASAHGFVANPVVGVGATRIVADYPAEYSTARIAHIQTFVVPGKEKFVMTVSDFP